MKAIGYYTPQPVTSPDALVDIELPTPRPGPSDLLVAVNAVSVNPVDVKSRASAAPPKGEARILGFDAAGVVIGVGSEVRLFKPGDEVFYAGAINRPGTNSELHLVDERIVGRKPRTLSFSQAAALPLTSITAWELLFDRLGVPYGTKAQNGTILIINGAGGVGSILTQIARRLTGLTVVATASRPETIAWCYEMGAHHVIDHHRSLTESLHEIGILQIEYVASLTATDKHLSGIADAIAPQGRLALIDDPEVLDIVKLKRKSVSVHWELMFTRSLFQTQDTSGGSSETELLSTIPGIVRGDDGDLKFAEWSCRAGQNNVIIRTDGTVAPCFPMYGATYDWGNIDRPHFDQQQLAGMKKTCQQHCFSTLNHNLAYCYNDARVIKWLWSNVIKNKFQGGVRSFED